MIALESLLFFIACLGAASHLNDMTEGPLRRRIAFALVGGGALGCALEPFWPAIEPGARFVLALGLALVAWPIIWRDLRAVFGGPVPAREDRRGRDQHIERRFGARH